jgi:hypothetical protein
MKIKITKTWFTLSWITAGNKYKYFRRNIAVSDILKAPKKTVGMERQSSTVAFPKQSGGETHWWDFERTSV